MPTKQDFQVLIVENLDEGWGVVAEQKRGIDVHSKKSSCFILLACNINSTISFPNPDALLYTRFLAVENEGQSTAVICTISGNGTVILISGCNTVRHRPSGKVRF